MKERHPSETCLKVAYRRAAHQVVDHPRIFDDPLALRILGLSAAPCLDPRPEWLQETPFSPFLRGSVVARSRYTEEELDAAVQRGVRQYVVLGAGLDTFACRNPYPADLLQVFEVDHPATQTWKRSCLERAGIPIPPTVTFVPVDFETQALADALEQAGFDAGRAAFFSWLGVVQYLTGSAITATLCFVAAMPPGSGIVFDYMILPSLLSPAARRGLDTLSEHVASSGEPFRSFFDPSDLQSTLQAMGFRDIEDLSPEAMNSRYFQSRTDKLRVGTLAHLMHARI